MLVLAVLAQMLLLIGQASDLHHFVPCQLGADRHATAGKGAKPASQP